MAKFTITVTDYAEGGVCVVKGEADPPLLNNKPEGRAQEIGFAVYNSILEVCGPHKEDVDE